MTFCCSRCQSEVAAVWATVEVFSRFGDVRALHLCQLCTSVVFKAVNIPVDSQEVSMTVLEDFLRDPEDIDEAEHHASCKCHECDLDFHLERMRDERMFEAS